eukprot:TRINITY_DN4027_c0_g1_i2.p3 TRINITY_DN4027_c0_g1~~TRINITY_DN4027_c0_g1_i2.p3  ORF type:complete len:261 (-),score=141.66 TRINITY_DN4027_c0_g1_i2:15-797(-)
MYMFVALAVALAALASPIAAAGFCDFGKAFVATGPDGNRDYVDTGLTVDVGGSFTLEAWVWAAEPEAPTWHPIVSRAAPFWRGGTTEVPNVFADFNFQIDDYGRLSFFMGNGEASPWQYGLLLISAQRIAARTWTHVAVSVEAPGGGTTPSTGTLYINGEPVDHDTWGSGSRQFAPTAPVQVGRYDNTDRDRQFFSGKLAGVRVWPTSKSAEDIRGGMFGGNSDGAWTLDVEAGQGVVQHDGPLAPVYLDKIDICGELKQ